MHQFEELYYTINKTFLMTLGIWPHDRSRLVFLRRVLIFIFSLTFIVPQLAVLITTKFNMALFVKTMSFVFLSMLITTQYCMFMFLSKTIRILHHHIEEDLKIIRNKLESEIIQKHAHEYQNYTLFAVWYLGFSVVVGGIIQFFPIILDFVSPLNEPRPLKLLIPMEYLTSQDYFYTKAFHAFSIILMYAAILSATLTQLLLFFYHCFGMFKIVSHRIEHLNDDLVLHMPNCEKERAICKRIIHVVIAHRRALEFSNILTSTFNMPFSGVIISLVPALSINLCKFVQMVTVLKNVQDLLASLSVVLYTLMFMFVGTYLGQKCIDCTNEIFRLIYGTSWYLMPVPSQKLILFLIIRSNKDLCFTFGCILVINLRSFATLINTALSYVAVMISIQ